MKSLGGSQQNPNCTSPTCILGIQPNSLPRGTEQPHYSAASNSIRPQTIQPQRTRKDATVPPPPLHCRRPNWQRGKKDRAPRTPNRRRSEGRQAQQPTSGDLSTHDLPAGRCSVEVCSSPGFSVGNFGSEFGRNEVYRGDHGTVERTAHGGRSHRAGPGSPALGGAKQRPYSGYTA